MKLLDLRFLMILTGVAVPVTAMPLAEGITVEHETLSCGDSVVCSNSGETLFSVKQRPTQAASKKVISLPEPVLNFV